MPGLLERLNTDPVLLADGAWGSALIQRGLDVALEPADAWNLHERACVGSLAADYLDAGADILTTNTFGANRIRLSDYGLARKTATINRRGVEIAREAERARRDLDRPVLIAGSMGPARGPGAPRIDDAKLHAVFYEQAACLAGSGVNFFLLETMTDPAEARIAVRAAQEAAKLEIVCTFAFRERTDGEFETWSGASVETAFDAVLGAGADIVGANCVPATESLEALALCMRRAAGTRPLWLKPNAGQPSGEMAGRMRPQSAAGRIRAHLVHLWRELKDELNSEALSRRHHLRYPAPLSDAPLDRVLDALGHGVIGGCCGSTPRDIHRLRQLLDGRAGPA